MSPTEETRNQSTERWPLAPGGCSSGSLARGGPFPEHSPPRAPGQHWFVNVTFFFPAVAGSRGDGCWCSGQGRGLRLFLEPLMAGSAR